MVSTYSEISVWGLCYQWSQKVWQLFWKQESSGFWMTTGSKVLYDQPGFRENYAQSTTGFWPGWSTNLDSGVLLVYRHANYASFGNFTRQQRPTAHNHLDSLAAQFRFDGIVDAPAPLPLFRHDCDSLALEVDYPQIISVNCRSSERTSSNLP